MMREHGPASLGNMCAPPRSTVQLPRLPMPAPPARDGDRGRALPEVCGTGNATALDAAAVPDGPHHGGDGTAHGPGGGLCLSAGRCVCRAPLQAAVGAWLGIGVFAPVLTGPLGLARALVSIASHADARDLCNRHFHASRVDLDRTAAMANGELVEALATALAQVTWPDWVPPVGFALACSWELDGPDPLQPTAPPTPATGIANPLLAARIVAGIRGPVFLRSAAPALAALLDPSGGCGPTAAWEIWQPTRPRRRSAAMALSPPGAAT